MTDENEYLTALITQYPIVFHFSIYWFSKNSFSCMGNTIYLCQETKLVLVKISEKINISK